MVSPTDPGGPVTPADGTPAPEDAHADDAAWFPQTDAPSPNVPPMVSISTSTTPDVPIAGWSGEPAAVGSAGAGPDGEPDSAPDPDGGDWLVGDEDLARATAPATVPTTTGPTPPAAPVADVLPATPAVRTLVVTPPAPRVLAADPAGTIHRHHRRPSIERVVAWGSALVGAGGILLGLMLALVNVEKWPDASTCKAYKAAHHGSGAFGCGGTRGLATVLPPVVTAVLVVGILAVVWIPHHSARRRLELIAGLAALLVAAALVEALVYTALP